MFERNLLEGKIALVTGGGTGIGFSIGKRYGELGASIAICGRRENVLADAVFKFKEAGIDADSHRCDVRDPTQVSETVDHFMDRFGKIDVLVNNAAGNFVSPTEKLSPHAFDAVIGIVLHGTVYMTLELGKRWIRNGQHGVVLDIVTTYAWTGSGYVVPSAAAKAGVLALVRSLAVEWAKYGIRHVAIAPGPFPTEATRKNLFPIPEIEDRIVQRVPLKRPGRMDEIANLAAYLVSDGAEYINGSVVTIDGGEWLKGAGQFNHLENLTEDQWKMIYKISRKKE
ncbi:2, 4-dienoyl-CoA reductase (NADPH) precursor related protein [Thermoplasma acidophilum]|uniref:2, 4-dienoyl-CoA reductase (NADPH) related protein n=1 Tax=Thermoplasma acidophilum (strain ATCC 25905 / DSM 1728 / JCM 9062 / NBRC 15155 / AMRC-C165) TaxID=273075 RepID=Q9HLM2_THEAC|nr:SDR family oxidoreductase [Thermoplasma acidophilum]CAC11351.1 2, 4-dienoyl-CoA reductase (NADPH) precursor related protein [Thermoplasma acidophilum]